MTVIVASETIRYQSIGLAVTSSNSYIKAKELTMTDNYTGSWRITFDLAGDNDGDPWVGYGKIYKNGVAWGIERTKSDEGFQTFSQDFSSLNIVSGDLIQLYIHGENPMSGRNQIFEIKFDPPVNKSAMFSIFTIF